MKIIVIFIVTGFLFLFKSVSYSDQDSSAGQTIDMEQILLLIEEKKCEDAWDIIWHSAVNGSGVAYELLAQALYSGAIVPPSIYNDKSNFIRNIVFFSLSSMSIYSKNDVIKNHFPAFNDIKDNLLDKYFSFYGDKYFLKNCTHGDADWDSCLEQAITSQYLPTKGQFIQELEAANRLGITATCFVIGHSKLDLEVTPLDNFENIDKGSSGER